MPELEENLNFNALRHLGLSNTPGELFRRQPLLSAIGPGHLSKIIYIVASVRWWEVNPGSGDPSVIYT